MAAGIAQSSSTSFPFVYFVFFVDRMSSIEIYNSIHFWSFGLFDLVRVG